MTSFKCWKRLQYRLKVKEQLVWLNVTGMFTFKFLISNIFKSIILSQSSKLCKQLKIDPNPFVLKHYKDGAFHKDYDRKLSKKSLLNFLKDPAGDLPWNEVESAKDVLHLPNEKVLFKYDFLTPNM